MERKVAVPDLPAAATVVAIAGEHVWVSFAYGVAHLEGGEWTTYGDEAGWTSRRRADAKETRDVALGVGVFTVGMYATATAWSTPVSLVGKQRLLPTATTSFAGGVPAVATVALLAGATYGHGGGQLGDLARSLALVLGVATIPLVSLSTYATGELGFRGTNASGGYWGALAGTAAGALVWTVFQNLVLGDATFDDWWWSLPVGAAFVGTASTTGYLLAGQGFSR